MFSRCAQKEGVKGPLLGRVSLFMDLCTSVIVDAKLGSWDVGEQTMAELQLPEVVKTLKGFNQDKLLFVYDRGYPSLKFIQQHIDLKADFLFRLLRKMYVKLWDRVNSGETDFSFILENQQKEVRVIAVTLNTGEIEVLITSLFEFPVESIVKIYALRWQIEECFKRLKIPAELENFSEIYPEAICQEFYSHMVMMNILSLHLLEVQPAWNPDKLPHYRLNFSLIFGVMRQKLEEVLVGTCSEKSFKKLFLRILPRAKIKVISDRHFSRHKAHIPKRHHVFRKAC